MKKSTILAVTLLILAIGSFCWCLGVASDAFRNPAFSSFWWLSHKDANIAQFIALSIGSAALMCGISYLPLHKATK